MLLVRLLAALGLVAGLTMAAGFTFANGAAIDTWLEDATGETSTPQQLNALAWFIAKPDPQTADFVPVDHAGIYPYGANTFFEQEVEEWKLRKSMEMLRAAGVKWVRQQMPWDRLEVPAKGRYETPSGSSTWTSYDTFIRLANEYDLEIVARLDLPPEWARREPFPWEYETYPAAAPRDLQDYGDFVETFARRYKGQIRYYQIWNEPNLFSDWGEAIDARKYTDMLRIASTRLKAVDPEITVVSAAIAATYGTPDGFNQDDLSFIQQMYDAGAAQHFDVLAVQGHGLWTGPNNPHISTTQTNFARLELVREIMVRNGDARTAVWVSELGWNAQPLDHPKPPSHGRVTPEQQARYTVQAYERAQREWPWVGVMFYWHFRRVYEENRADVDFYYRMADPDFTTHPVYDAYREMTEDPPVLGVGMHQESHWALTYGPGWTPVSQVAAASEGAIMVGSQPGSQMSLRFSGSDLALAQIASPQGGQAAYEVRNSRGELVRNGNLDFRAAALSPRVVPLVERLQPGEYDVTITTTQSDVAIDAFIVRNDALGFLQPALAGLLVVGSVAIVGLLVISGRRGSSSAQ